MIEVLATGPLTTIQDLGRPGLAELGVGRSGAADRRSMRLANRLVGNLEGAACCEVTFGGLAVRLTRRTVVAFSGAPCPVAIDGRAAGMYAPINVSAGQVLRVGVPARGLRTYVAVRGGIAVRPVLGSRATDQLAGIGPPPLKAGNVLAIGEDAVAVPVVDFAPQASYPDVPVLRIVPGPRDDWFAAESHALLTLSPYEVTADSNRIGMRLKGPPLQRTFAGEMPPEAMVRGALQVPPDGQPVLFMADHPVTGGYPVIGVVVDDDLDLAAQARPGQQVRFQVSRQRGRG